MKQIHQGGHDDAARVARARTSLLGLSVGDAFGQQFFRPDHIARSLIAERSVPAPPWPYTDDTAMAAGIVEVLGRHSCIDQDELAAAFACGYVNEPWRGYGVMAQHILRRIAAGADWRQISRAAFGGEGSMGNGGAMRAAPVGAFFADDLAAAAEQARLSAEVTHAHLEGQAGAQAVGVAAAWAVCRQTSASRADGRELLEAAVEHTITGLTRTGLERAVALPFDSSVGQAASALGNGSRVLTWDTVPFALWCAARHIDSYEEALWTTVSGLGDRDTTCAIVGGIVVLAAGPESIPAGWLSAAEQPPWPVG